MYRVLSSKWIRRYTRLENVSSHLNHLSGDQRRKSQVSLNFTFARDTLILYWIVDLKEKKRKKKEEEEEKKKEEKRERKGKQVGQMPIYFYQISYKLSRTSPWNISTNSKNPPAKPAIFMKNNVVHRREVRFSVFFWMKFISWAVYFREFISGQVGATLRLAKLPGSFEKTRPVFTPRLDKRHKKQQ